MVLLDKGAYGCLFAPYINCSGKVTSDYTFLSKVQEKGFQSENEILISKKIRNNLPDKYKNFFAPSVHSCDINIKQFTHMNPELNECSRIQNFKSEFILLKIPFIGYNDSYISYQDYVLQDIDNREILMNLIDGYKHLLQAIQLLQQDNVAICHFDLNDSNILFSQDKTNPVIIDFGLSFSIEEIAYKTEEDIREDVYVGNYLKDYFYTYEPEYYVWPLEVHYINFLLNVNSKPSYKDIVSLCHTYVNHNTPLKNNFSKNFCKKYEDLCVNTLEEYRSGIYNPIDIIKKYWKTWDNYALSIMYLQIIYYLNLSFVKKKYTLKFMDNLFIAHFTKLLLQNIHPNPSHRWDAKTSEDRFDDFFYNKDINDVENYAKILSKYTKNKKKLGLIVSKDKDQLKKLLRKMKKTA
jgi:hypothetical protein